MTNLFDVPSPVRVVLHVNLWEGHGRFDWDGLAQNPDTGDLLALVASPGNLRRDLGPQLSRMFLWTMEALRADEAEPTPER